VKVGDLVEVPMHVMRNQAVGACVGVVLDVTGWKVLVGMPHGNDVWDQQDLRKITSD
jgi:hypothetical protein